ncbi:MAG: BamA/TamA family outer membrane protein [Planctomycetota bacterium]
MGNLRVVGFSRAGIISAVRKMSNNTGFPRAAAVTVVALAATAFGCTRSIPRNEITAFFAKDHIRGAAPEPRYYRMTFIPLPVIDVDPNEGFSGGALPVFLFRETDRITSIVVPSIYTNETEGVTFDLHLRKFPNLNAAREADIKISTEGSQNFDFEYRDEKFLEERAFLRLRGRYQVSLTDRFYGVGCGSAEGNQSNFTRRQGFGSATFGLKLAHHSRVSITERYRHDDLGPGGVEGVPDLIEKFPSLAPDTEAREFLAHRMDYVYDSRNSPDIPTRGTYVNAGVEMALRGVGSSRNYTRWVGEAIRHIPTVPDRAFTVLRLAGASVNGADLPFYMLSSLGGLRTLRGYGEGRFTDENAVVANIEERLVFRKLRFFDVESHVQFAAFVDIGGVFADRESIDDIRFHTVVGGGLRFVVPESHLVATIDIGVGREGPAGFIALGYPF